MRLAAFPKSTSLSLTSTKEWLGEATATITAILLATATATTATTASLAFATLGVEL
jgi:hypothetical protein